LPEPGGVFTGSCILLPYCFVEGIRQWDKSFVASLIIAGLVMTAMYYYTVRQTGLPKKWFWGWIICLATAIALQLFVVFKMQDEPWFRKSTL
jgi:uncharacterized membrane-anchored protein